MKKTVDPQKTALFVGGFALLMHAAWSLLIAANFAQPFMDWIYGLHSLNNPFRVMPFDITRTITLLVVAFVFGYVVGWALGMLWNAMHKK